tara:strand:- start:799 stop:1242 length:444 start_codon:yes stop_codon:yes gene_type:complete
MATTATITLASTDISGDGLALTNAATLLKAGTTTNMAQTTGLARKTITGNTVGTPVPLILSAGSNAGAAKIYISNKSEDATEYVNVTMGTSSGQEIGRLYAGDWMFMPWTQTDANADILVDPSVTTGVTLEYMVIHEVAANNVGINL